MTAPRFYPDAEDYAYLDRLVWRALLAVALMAIVVMTAALIATTPAQSAPIHAGHQPVVPQPPRAFDHPYHGDLTIVTVPLRFVVSQCAKEYAAAGTVLASVVPPNTLACAVPDEDAHAWCRIVLPEPEGFTAHTLRQIKKHEIGHCNGWPADHPNARIVN